MNKKNRNVAVFLIGLVVLTVGLFMGGYFYLNQTPKSNPGSKEEAYTVIANETDGPEQIFEKAFEAYAKKNNITVSSDQLRLVAEYMASTSLTGKAYWVDKNGQRHELWIGTGDKIILTKNNATFVISNSYTENQKKTISIHFGFEDAAKQLKVIKSQPIPNP